MNTQSITLSLPKDILLKVELLAERRQTSTSALLAEELEKLVRQDEAYNLAKRRNLRILRKGLPLGTYGKLAVERDELHE
ncbi:MAG: CopG family transcriptional regulator [Candidatus Promineifilaceae bacterium]|jgi:predicted transcriptional regulator